MRLAGLFIGLLILRLEAADEGIGSYTRSPPLTVLDSVMLDMLAGNAIKQAKR